MVHLAGVSKLAADLEQEVPPPLDLTVVLDAERESIGGSLFKRQFLTVERARGKVGTAAWIAAFAVTEMKASWLLT
jgi:hypothetical protein